MKHTTKTLFTLMIISLFACNSSKKTTDGAPSSDYEILYQQAYGGQSERHYQVIKTKEDYQKALAKGAITEDQKNELAKVDFGQYVVAVLHAGTKNTGGYDIGVASVRVDGETTYVVVDETGPKPGENVTMALTNPYCIVLLDKNERFVFED